jgi:hypothetical protein
MSANSGVKPTSANDGLMFGHVLAEHLRSSAMF